MTTMAPGAVGVIVTAALWSERENATVIAAQKMSWCRVDTVKRQTVIVIE